VKPQALPAAANGRAGRVCGFLVFLIPIQKPADPATRQASCSLPAPAPYAVHKTDRFRATSPRIAQRDKSFAADALFDCSGKSEPNEFDSRMAEAYERCPSWRELLNHCLAGPRQRRPVELVSQGDVDSRRFSSRASILNLSISTGTLRFSAGYRDVVGQALGNSVNCEISR